MSHSYGIKRLIVCTFKRKIDLSNAAFLKSVSILICPSLTEDDQEVQDDVVDLSCVPESDWVWPIGPEL